MGPPLTDEEVAALRGIIGPLGDVTAHGGYSASAQSAYNKLVNHKPGQPEVRARPSHVRLMTVDGSPAWLPIDSFWWVRQQKEVFTRVGHVGEVREPWRVTETPDEIARMVGVGDE